jgi:hypothetical protein
MGYNGLPRSAGQNLAMTDGGVRDGGMTAVELRTDGV